MLNVMRYHNPWSLFDLFGEGQWCPVCLGESFTYTEGNSIWCDNCNASFVVRPTAGDPGVVLDCYPDPHGRWAIRPGEAGNTPRSDLYYFWQVLKTCDDGLDGRQRWLTEAKRFGRAYTREKVKELGPLFHRLYQYGRSYEFEDASKGYYPGLYFADQCLEKDDARHTCQPLPTARPLVKLPFYERIP